MIEPIQGQVVRVSNYSGAADNPTGGFRDDTGTLVDPLTVNLSTTAPDGTPTDYSLAQLTREATGLYFTYVDTTDQPGVWAYVWSSSEPQTYEPGSFPVGVQPTNAADIATIRMRTSGAAWMTDSDLTTLLDTVLQSDGVTPDLWAISAMVLEQYQINNLLNTNTGASSIAAGDNTVTYLGSNQSAIDQVIRRYWQRADVVNRNQYLAPRIRDFHARPAHRPALLRRWWGVYPVLNGYPGAGLPMGDPSLEEQVLGDFAPLMLQENDL